MSVQYVLIIHPVYNEDSPRPTHTNRLSLVSGDQETVSFSYLFGNFDAKARTELTS